MFKKLLPAATFFLVSGLLCTQSSEARSLADIKSSKSIVIGITGNIPPFQYKTGSTYLGFEIETIKNIANDLGVDIIYKEVPAFGDLTKDLANDQVDAIISTVTLTSNHDKTFDLSAPYACLGASVVTTNPGIKTQNDLKGKKIGVVKGTVFESYAQKLPFDKQVISYTTREEQARDFLGNKFDAALGWKAMNPFLAKVFNVNLQDTPVLWSIPVTIMTQGGNNSLRSAINNSIYKMQRDGRFDTLDKKYFPGQSVNCRK